jgi:hypothetical protein
MKKILNIINNNKIKSSLWLVRRTFLRWEMDSIDISPEQFINTIVYIAHKNYSSDRSYVKRWRIIKLILKIADELNYTTLSSGFYKHGNYSFVVDSFLKNDLQFKSSLYGVKIRDDLINKEFSKIVLPVIENNKSFFIQPTPGFRLWAHDQQPPEEFKIFYNYSDSLLDGFNDIDRARSREDIIRIGNHMSNIISDFDPCLKHVNNEILDIYFDFTDSFEGIITAMSHRSITREAKPALEGLHKIYYSYIFSFFPPFKQTVNEGDNIEAELQKYRGSLVYSKSKLMLEYPKIKRRLGRKKLIPTLDELTCDIEGDISQLDLKEKKKIIDLFDHIR